MLADQPKALLNKVQCATLLFEPDGTLHFFNKAAARLLGLEPDATELHMAFWQWLEHHLDAVARILEDPSQRLAADVPYPLAQEPSGSSLHVTISHFEDEWLMATCWPNPPRAPRADTATPAPSRPEHPHAEPTFEHEIEALSRIWDAFPCEALLIDEHWRILKRNARSRERQPEVSTCYAYRGLDAPCASCPLQQADGEREQTLSHSDQGTYITETLGPVYGGRGVLLTFTDHTGKVELLHSIKAQRAKAKERTVTLARLLTTLNKMRVGLQPVEVVRYGVHNLKLECQARGVILLVEDERKRGLWLKEREGVESWMLDELADTYLRQRRGDPGTEVVLSQAILPRSLGEVHQAPITTKNKTQIGLLVVVQPQIENADFIFSLFHNSLNNYLRERSLARQLALMAITDELTATYNRIYLDRCLPELAARWEQDAVPFAVVLADANGLKQVNDHYGHKAGDELIQEVARCLKHCAGPDDLVGRLGGDEFAILLPGADLASAEHYIERLCDLTSHSRFTLRPDLELDISISLGAASSASTPVAELFKTADEALYAMKKKHYEKQVNRS